MCVDKFAEMLVERLEDNFGSGDEIMVELYAVKQIIRELVDDLKSS